MIIYIHGFNSSPQSSKAVLMSNYCTANTLSCAVPTLPHQPDQAIAMLARLCDSAGRRALLIGSSLGGYYSTWLVENQYALAAVLINPAVMVADKLASEVGKQLSNYHTDEQYLFTEQHVVKLRKLQIAKPSKGKYWLLVQQGDEVLDYREAESYYAGHQQDIEPDGDHSFVGFERYLAKIADWARELNPANPHPQK